MSAADRRDVLKHDDGSHGLDVTDGKGRRRASDPTGAKKTFWSSLKVKPQRSATELTRRQKKALSAQISASPTPSPTSSAGAASHHENPLGMQFQRATPDLAEEREESDEATPRRSRSFREKTSDMFSRVARRVSRRKRARESPSVSRSNTPSSQVSSSGASAAGYDDVSSTALLGRGARNIASRGEATSAEYTDNPAGSKNRQSSALLRPGIQVTDASIADISAAVQQLTERTADPFTNTTPGSSPGPRRRAYTADPNKNLATLLAPKKWLSRNRLLCEWVPSEEEPVWFSPNSDVLKLDERSVLTLSAVEHRALRKHLHKHLETELGFSFHVPKDPEDHGHRSGGLNSVLRHGKLGAGGEKGSSPSENCVFGIPLHRVLENDRSIARRILEDVGISSQFCASSMNSLDETSSDHQSVSSEAEEGDDPEGTDGGMNGTISSMDFGTICNDQYMMSDEAASVSALDIEDVQPDMRMTRTFSLSEAVDNPLEMAELPRPPAKKPAVTEPDNPPFTATAGILGLAAAPLHFLGRSADNLLKTEQPATRNVEALTLSQIMKQQRKAQARLASQAEVEIRVRDHKKDVPEFLTKAFDFLKEHGMQTVGIFRIAGSKRRSKQIREDMDNGFEISFHEGIHQPCDVAALVKNFLRDLPEPLLTRPLFPAFVAASKIDDQKRQAAVLRGLVCLLPMCNRDTLHELLGFLHHVSDFAEDQVNPDGSVTPGHKMDMGNLAVVFGPNIMRPYKTKSGAEYTVSSNQQASNQNFIHAVVLLLIRYNDELFQVPPCVHHDILLAIRSKAPTLLDALLQRRLGKSPQPSVQRTAKTSTSSSSDLPGSPVTYGGSSGAGTTAPGAGAASPANGIGVSSQHSRSSLQSEARTVDTSNFIPHPLVTPTRSVESTASERRQSQRAPIKMVSGDDFAELNPENGELVPSFALPGSPLSSSVLSATSPLEILTITVHDIADRTPPEFKRRLPGADGRSKSVDYWSSSLMAPPDDAVFGNWQNRWPSGEDVRSLRSQTSGTDKKSDTAKPDKNNRSKSTLRDEAISRDDLSPMSGELTPLAGTSQSSFACHAVVSTPLANDQHLPSFDPSKANPAPTSPPPPSSRTKELYAAPGLAANGNGGDITPVNALGPPQHRRFSLKNRHKPLDRRYTEPPSSFQRQLSSDDAPSSGRKGRRFQQLRHYFENFTLGSGTQPVDDFSPGDMPASPGDTAPPPRQNGFDEDATETEQQQQQQHQDSNSGVHVSDGVTNGNSHRPSTTTGQFWERFKSENPETLV
ncbi:uncharacterized protein LOC135828283 [Sycon ciliatum]|uniref:uncharacterized protein LOC135828283 n=1 Tax=Sycon ciliatum TaxID=27933 RepID=UPI0031F6EB96